MPKERLKEQIALEESEEVAGSILMELEPYQHDGFDTKPSCFVFYRKFDKKLI